MNNSEVFFGNDLRSFGDYNGRHGKIDLAILQKSNGAFVVLLFCFFVESVMKLGGPT